jgi:excisionase family DNA binding protein
MDKLLLSPSEAAEALSIGRSKLYELLASGQLDSVHIGSCRRIPLAAVMDYVQGLEAGRRRPSDDDTAVDREPSPGLLYDTGS